MSLGSFHLLFIVISTLLALVAGAWGMNGWASERSALDLTFGLLSLASVPVLVVYGVRVRAKLKQLGGLG